MQVLDSVEHRGYSHGRRAHRDPIVAPVRCVPRRLHGGGRRRPIMDGFLHAQRSWILTGIPECAFDFWDVSDAIDPLRSKPRDHHRGNYALCCPYTVGSAGNSTGSHCRREYRDLARPVKWLGSPTKMAEVGLREPP